MAHHHPTEAEIDQANDDGEIEIGTGAAQATGNNVLWEGFGRYTKTPDPIILKVTKTFHRTYTSAAAFPKTAGTTLEWPTQTDNDATNLTDDPNLVTGKWKHGGIHIPYWYKEASMHHSDWNLPDDVIGYKVKSFGFHVPNMALHIMNNSKGDPNEVPAIAPPNARFWTFIDTNNDYGIPQTHNDAFAHNDNFTDTDAMSNQDHRLLKECPERIFVLPSDAAMHLLGPGWKAERNNKYKAQDPNQFYNMKVHPGYTQQLVSEGNFGFTYEATGGPVVLFPANQSSTLDWTTISGSYAIHQYDEANDNITLHPWAHYQHTTTIPQNATPRQRATAYWYNDFHAKQGAQNKVSNDTYQCANQTGGRLEIANNTNRPYTKGSVGNQRLPITDKYGQNRLTVQRDRPPIFLMGVYPDVEPISDGTTRLFNYHANFQITYTSEVDFYIRTGYCPTYIPIGIGGMQTNQPQGEIVIGNHVIGNNPASRRQGESKQQYRDRLQSRFTQRLNKPVFYGWMQRAAQRRVVSEITHILATKEGTTT